VVEHGKSRAASARKAGAASGGNAKGRAKQGPAPGCRPPAGLRGRSHRRRARGTLAGKRRVARRRPARNSR
jgi:hypothetical protein